MGSSCFFFSSSPYTDEFLKKFENCHFADHSQSRPRLRNPWSVWKVARNIQKVIEKEKIDLVHSVMGYGHIFGGIAAKLAKIPEVWFQHGPTGHLDWITGRVPTHRVFANSRQIAEQEARYRPSIQSYPNHPGIQIICPGVNPIDIGTHDSDFLKFLKIRQDTKWVFALVGRISEMKGHLLFIEATQRVIQEFGQKTQIQFWIIGDAFLPRDQEYLKKVHSRIKELGIEAHFLLTGHLPNPYGAMAAADAIVNCSITPEPFGLTIIEGMMLGKTVIAPNCGGPIEIIEDRKTGLLFNQNKPESLADVMISVLSNEPNSREIAMNGKIHALKNFQAWRMVRTLESTYDSLMHSFSASKTPEIAPGSSK